MQQKSVILFRYFIVFLVVICTSCVKDDLLEGYDVSQKAASGLVVSKISFKAVRTNRQAFASLQNFRIQNGVTKKGMYYEEFGVFIDTTNIVSITGENRHSLTFQIINDDNLETIENLILNSNNGDSYEAYITVYDLTEQDREQLLNGEVLSNKKPSSVSRTATHFGKGKIGGDGADCASFIVVGGDTCPSGKHNLHSMQNGQCSYVNSGVYTPSPETIVRIVIDMDCLTGNPGGGFPSVVDDGSVYNFPGGSLPGSGGMGPGGTNPGNPGTSPDPTEPIRDPGDGTPIDTSPVLVVNRPTPCADLTNLMKSDPVNPQAEADIKPKLVELKSKTTLNYEVGYSLAKDQNGNYMYSQCRPSNTSPKEVACKAGLDEYLDMHTHYLGLVEMFSFMDVYAYWIMHKKVRPELKKEVTKIVVTKSCPTCPEVVYALKMEDFNKFAQKINDLIITDNPQEPTFSKKLKAANEKCKKEFQKSTNPEEIFLTYFKDAGIFLFRAENDLSNWNKLTLDANNQVKSTPCK